MYVSSKPALSILDILTGKEFIAVCLTMDQRGKAHCRLTACLTAIPLKNGPLFYQGCPSVDEANGRACRKRVDAFDFCSTCGVEVAPVPFWNLSKAAFRADDGEVFRLSALGDVAQEILGIDAQEAFSMEKTCL